MCQNTTNCNIYFTCNWHVPETDLLLLLPRLFLLHAGSPFLVSLFQHVQSMASVVLKFFSNISSSIQSIHLLFGLPGCLLPSISIRNTCFVTWSPSLCQTCPYHPSLFSCIFLCISVSFILFWISSFLILSHLVTPCTHLNIFISATFILLSCDFLIAHVSIPYVRRFQKQIYLPHCTYMPWMMAKLHTYAIYMGDVPHMKSRAWTMWLGVLWTYNADASDDNASVSSRLHRMCWQ